MALTMSDEQERELRARVGMRDADWRGVRIPPEPFAELDATRAKLAETERERDEARAEIAYAAKEGIRGLVSAAKDGVDRVAASFKTALAAYEAEFAPKPRTIREVAKDIAAQHDKGGTHFYAISEESMDELRAALAREGGE